MRSLRHFLPRGVTRVFVPAHDPAIRALRRLDQILDSYTYAGDFRVAFLPFEQAFWERQRLFGENFNGYGRQMIAHSARVAHDGARLLRFIGFSDRACLNFESAMKFHDLGKTHDSYDPAIWTLEERPTLEQRTEKKRHAGLGSLLVDESLAGAPAQIRNHPHILVLKSLMRGHHERIDGGGPEGLTFETMPLSLQIACIVDAYDGDRQRRPHQSHARTPAEALCRMAGLDDSGKYCGAFDRALVGAYARLKDPQTADLILQDTALRA